MVDLEANLNELTIASDEENVVSEIEVSESMLDEDQIIVSSGDEESDSIIDVMARESEILNDPERIEIDEVG